MTTNSDEDQDKKILKVQLLIPLIFLICWSIALSQYNFTDSAHIYASIDLAFCCLSLLFQSPGLYNIVGLISFFYGLRLYYDTTGTTIFGYFVWDSKPFLIRIMYFQLWTRLIMISLMGILIISTLGWYIYIVSCEFRDRLTLNRPTRPVETFSESTLEHQPTSATSYNSAALNAVLPVSEANKLFLKVKTWVLKQTCCSICTEDMKSDECLAFLPCGHAFHRACIEQWLCGNQQTCPVCRESVLDHANL
jgi:hypothetical protein